MYAIPFILCYTFFREICALSEAIESNGVVLMIKGLLTYSIHLSVPVKYFFCFFKGTRKKFWLYAYDRLNDLMFATSERVMYNSESLEENLIGLIVLYSILNIPLQQFYRESIVTLKPSLPTFGWTSKSVYKYSNCSVSITPSHPPLSEKHLMKAMKN